MREFALAASGFHVELLPNLASTQAPEETGVTFEENSALKALYYSRLTNEIVLADDSGLEVDALNRAPGVYSARYAGPDASDEANNNLLLRNLEGISDREARFVSVVTLARAGQVLASARGVVEGFILPAPRGTEGFGYDPIFFYPPFNRSFGEITDEAKLSVSARGKALKTALSTIAKLI